MMRYWFASVFFLLSGLLSQATYAQLNSRFLFYDIENGLSQNNVHAIYRDHEGLMWIGTQDGLNSFDGRNFTIYRHNEEDRFSISDQFILKIGEDKAGNLWIGTRNGLNRFDRATKKFFRYYTDDKQKHQFQASYGQFYFLPDSSLILLPGPYIFSPAKKKFKRIDVPNASTSTWFVNEFFNAWQTEPDGKFYFIKDIRKAERIYLGAAPYTAGHDYQDFDFVSYRDSLIFLYNNYPPCKLMVYDVKAQKIVSQFSTPSSVYHLNPVALKEIYLSHAKGLSKYHYGRLENFSSDEYNSSVLPPGTVLTSYKDPDGNLWIGTAGNGVGVSNKSFDQFTLIDPPMSNTLVSAVAVVDTQVFAGTRKGIFKLTDVDGRKKFIPFISDGSITALVRSGKNILAAVHGEGLRTYSLEGKLLKSLPLIYTVLSMYNAGDKILLCTVNGFFSIDGSDQLTDISSREKMTGRYIMSAFRDSRKNFWVAANDGLYLLDSNLRKIKFFNSDDDTKSFIKRTIVTSVTEDAKGNIWIGTIRNGVYRYDGKTSRHFTEQTGLSSEVVYNVITDSRGKIWATTSAGLNLFNEKENTFIQLSSFDGMPKAAFAFGAVAHSDSFLLFGTSKGLIICDASKIVPGTSKFTAMIADVRIDGKSVGHQNVSVYGDNHLLTIEFSCSPSFHTSNIFFQYRINGKNWNTLPVGTSLVSFNNLPYGKLRLQVRAATSHINFDQAEITTLTINSVAPLWKRTWFVIFSIVIMLFLTGASVFYFNRRKYRAALQRSEVERHMQKERARIARDLHDNIGAYTSALMAGLNHLKPHDAADREQIDGLKEYGSSIMGFLRETIWMLNAENLTITAFADRFKNYALRISRHYAVEVSFNEMIRTDKTLSPSSMLNLFRVLQEALQNALKHSGSSRILITFACDNNIECTVEDFGNGFDGNAKEGHYGVINMNQRALESGFELMIQSGESGTKIIIREK